MRPGRSVCARKWGREVRAAGGRGLGGGKEGEGAWMPGRAESESKQEGREEAQAGGKREERDSLEETERDGSETE
eukprot:219224-Rhodomonas_salina.2